MKFEEIVKINERILKSCDAMISVNDELIKKLNKSLKNE
jgi:hypothetical protein